MRKKKLLEIPQTEPPEYEEFRDRGMSVLAKSQYDPVEAVYNIDLYTTKDPLEETVVLSARYFASRREGKFISWLPWEGRWTTAIIDNVASYVRSGNMDRNGNYYWRPNPSWEFADGEEDIYLDSRQSIREWENRIRSDEYYSSLERKQRRINCMMDEKTPDLPEGFFGWMHETVFRRDYIYQTKDDRGTKAYCTACAGSWRIKKPYRAGYMACPKCGKKAIASFREKHESKITRLFLLQKCDGNTGEWMERIFKARAYWENGQQRRVEYDEQIRIIIPEGEDWGKCYYETSVRGNGSGQYSDRNSNYLRMSAGYLYPGNIDETRDLWPNSLRYSGIDEIAQRGLKTNINNLITQGGRWPFMEYLIKGRFYKLAAEIINQSMYEDFGLINTHGTTARETLQLGQRQVDRLRQQDGGFLMLSWLQYEYASGVRITPENLRYLESRGISAGGNNIQKALEYLPVNALVGYIRRQMEKSREGFFEGMLSTYCDYLDMAKKQKLNLAHEIFYKPRDLVAAHNACVAEGKKHEIEYKARGILEKFPDLPKVLAGIRGKYSYQGSEYSIIVPEKVEDIIREGRCLGHCIDTTDRYFERISRRVSYLVFLRKAGQEDTPWYTLEIEPGGTIRQQRTTGNNQNKEDVKRYMPFIREWQQEVKRRITQEDRELAKESRELRIGEYRDLREKKEVVWHGMLAGKLLADVLEADLVENTA